MNIIIKLYETPYQGIPFSGNSFFLLVYIEF